MNGRNSVLHVGKGKMLHWEVASLKMARNVSDSHLAKLQFPLSRPTIRFGWRYMGQDVNTVCGLFLCTTLTGRHVEAMPHLCIDDRKRQTPVRSWFSRTQAGLGSPIPMGPTRHKIIKKHKISPCHKKS